jgi:hypothetical protein
LRFANAGADADAARTRKAALTAATMPADTTDRRRRLGSPTSVV